MKRLFAIGLSAIDMLMHPSPMRRAQNLQRNTCRHLGVKYALQKFLNQTRNRQELQIPQAPLNNANSDNSLRPLCTLAEGRENIPQLLQDVQAPQHSLCYATILTSAALLSYGSRKILPCHSVALHPPVRRFGLCNKED